MKRRLLVIFALVLTPALYILYCASSLIALIFEDGLKNAVSLRAIEEHANGTDVTHPIPKIIHQTWKNDKIPEQWQIAQYTWYGLFVPPKTLD